jgi:hypothetical protein
MWEMLVEPRRPGARPWLVLTSEEVEPMVVESDRPSLVVWTSLWPDRPNDRIRFAITSDGASGSSLKWTLESPDPISDPAKLGRMRYRLNYLINGQMRLSFGQ